MKIVATSRLRSGISFEVRQNSGPDRKQGGEPTVAVEQDFFRKARAQTNGSSGLRFKMCLPIREQTASTPAGALAKNTPDVRSSRFTEQASAPN
jgi:hypothetical protein